MLNGKESACHCRRLRRQGFDPCVRKIPWRRNWQPTPVFLPGKSHEKPGRLQSIVSQWIRYNWAHTHIHSESINCRLIQNNYSLLLCNWGISSVSFNSDIVYFLLWNRKAKCRNELFKHSETVIAHSRFCSLRSELPSSHRSQGLNKGDWQRGKWRLKSGSHSAPQVKHTSISPENGASLCAMQQSCVPGMAISNLNVHQRGEREYCTSIQRQRSWQCATTWEIFGQIQYRTLFSSVA